MDTKWKKRKRNLAGISFALGVSLLLIGGTGSVGWLRANGGMPSARHFLTEDDYQKTSAFRHFIENQLDHFLDMSCGDAVYDNGYGYSGNAFYGGISQSMDVVEEAYVMQGQPDQEATAVLGGMEAEIQSEEALQGNLTREQKEESILKYNDAIKDDKNILYRISFWDKEKYSNRQYSGWNGTQNSMPKGYNFLLYFDGEKVTIQKDGEQIDVYGDGLYREDSAWCVPGYRNFAVKNKWKGAKIIMLAAEEPRPLLKSVEDRDTFGYRSGLYRVYKDFMERRSLLLKNVFYMAAGSILLALYLFLRNGRGELNGRLAAVTAKIWFEIKVLLPVGCAAYLLAQGGVFYSLELAYRYGGTAYEAVSELPYAFWDSLSWHPAPFLAAFWLFYLLAIDLRRNPGGYKNGICAKVAQGLFCRGFFLSVSKRMVKRTYLIFALTGLLLCYTLCLFCMSLIWDFDPVVAYWQMVAFTLVCVLLAAEYAFQKKNRRVAEDLERLDRQISGIRDGDYEAEAASFMQDPDLRRMAQELEDIQRGLGIAVEERIKSERMKVELVANVSHDIKTPLTSVISYIQLLKQEDGLPDYVVDYIRILDEKSERLKNMVQDVFAVSQAASGQLSVEYKELDLGKLLYQTLADMEEVIKDSPVTVKTQIPKNPVTVCTDGQRMYRVFQNLIGNAVKYSLEGSRVYVTLNEEGTQAVASVKNTSSKELDREMDFAERFVRGDESRTDGGSGLGLSIAKSFTEACGGTFRLEVNADLFVVTVSLPVSTLLSGNDTQ